MIVRWPRLLAAVMGGTLALWVVQGDTSSQVSESSLGQLPVPPAVGREETAPRVAGSTFAIVEFELAAGVTVTCTDYQLAEGTFDLVVRGLPIAESKRHAASLTFPSGSPGFVVLRDACGRRVRLVLQVLR